MDVDDDDNYVDEEEMEEGEGEEENEVTSMMMISGGGGMGDEEEEEEVDQKTGIRKARSAYMYYSKSNIATFRSELIKEGKEISLGTLAAHIGGKWKSLSKEERAVYEKMAKDDKERYRSEMAVRDQEVKSMSKSIINTHTHTHTHTHMHTHFLLSSCYQQQPFHF